MRPFHLRCDSLLFGVLLSYSSEFRPELIKSLLQDKGRILLIVSIVCITPALVLEQRTAFMYIPGLTMLYLGYGGILLYALRCPVGDGPLVRLMSGIGRASYSVYLWHLPVGWLTLLVLQDRLHWGRNVVFGIYVAASLVIGMGMARVVEYPALKLRERLFPESGGSLDAKLAREQSVPKNRMVLADSDLLA
jgi:peptidoglycan/LPS O-acetylase OafA/YrhL